MRHYTVADGLAQNTVGVIYQDRAGFLWFGTAQGLSRFDGEEFRNYGRNDGLPHPIINGIVEDRRGRLWIAPFEAGMARAREGSAGQLFTSFAIAGSESNAVSHFTPDAEGRVWLVAYDGIYRMTPGDSEPIFERVVAYPRPTRVSRIFADRQGDMWFGRESSIVRVKHDDTRAVETFEPAITGGAPIIAITQRRDGAIIAATATRIVRLAPGADPASRDSWQVLIDRADGRWTTVACDSYDRLWLGTADGMFQWDDDRRMAVPRHGLDGTISTIAEDRQRNVWVATYGLGVYKISRDMIVSYTRAHGLPSLNVQGAVEGADGRVYALFEGFGIAEIKGSAAVTVPGSMQAPFVDIGRRVLRDSRGDWWFATLQGLFHARGPAPAVTRAERIALPANPRGPGASALFEDPNHDLWIGTETEEVLRVDQSTRAITRLPGVSLAGRFAADRTGAIWMSNFNALARWRHGRREIIEKTEGLPETQVRNLFVDSRGWLWIGLRYHGVSVVKQPDADRLAFINYSTANGIAGEEVASITEDGSGRVYLGTGNGLDRFDPRTGAIRHFTTADGLASSTIRHLMRDHAGDIWISTSGGLSRLRPDTPDPSPFVPTPRFTRVQIGGDDMEMPWRGLPVLDPVAVAASQNNLLIEYVAPSFQGERTTQYQYRLDGADRDWSAPTRQRSINYGHLAPGRYAFSVRAVSADSGAGPETATLALQILPPYWQRWWFGAAIIVVAAGIAGAFHRLRVRQILAMERVRRQVSLDLHDEVGSGLAQIAVLSDAASDAPSPSAATTVGELARSLRESMSDIVWSVDPSKDRLVDLVQRMKPVAYNLFEADGIRVHFDVPDERTIARIALAPDRRRHLLLIFKEALTNIARHASATEVRIAVRLEPGVLQLVIQDNGRGFDRAGAGDGNGLQSIERRAAELRATLTIRTAPGEGTSIETAVPL